MASFAGQPFLPYQTPTGKVVQFPKAFADQFSGLVPVQPEPPAPIAPPAPVTPPPGIRPTLGAELEAATPVEPPPPPKPVTTADLQQQGFAGALNQTNAALADAAAAGKQVAEAEAQQQLAQADAYAARNVELDKLFAQRAREAEENQAAIAARSTEYEKAVQSYASTKIDRDADHPILAAIGVAIGGIGSAMKNEGNNPAITALYTAIDRKVAGQMADLDRRKSALGMKREGIDMLRQQASDRLAATNLAISAESERAARRIEEITARSNSEIVRANGLKLAADLRGRGADAFTAAVERQTMVDTQDKNRAQQERESRRAAGQAAARLREDARQFDLNFEEGKRTRDLDRQAALDAARAQGSGERQKQLFELSKENETRGIGDISTGEPLLQPEGVKMLDQAKKLEGQAQQFAAKAAQATDAGLRTTLEAQARMLQQKASEVRGEAEINHTFRAGDTTEAKEIRKLVTSTQAVASLADDVIRLRQKHGPNWLKTSEGEQMMQTKAALIGMELKDAYTLGALDKGSQEVIDKITGGDPTKITAGDFLPKFLGAAEGTSAKLEGLIDAMETRTALRLKSARYKGDWKARRSNPPAAKMTPEEQATKAVLEGRTAAEQFTDMERGTAGRGVERVLYALAPNDPGSETSREARSQNNSSMFGLDKKQQDYVDKLVASANQGNEKAREQLAQLSRSDRESLKWGVLRTIEANSPALLDEAGKSYLDSRRVRVPPQNAPAAKLARLRELSSAPVADLEELAKGGDMDAKQMLAAMSERGNPEAVAAVKRVIGAVR